MRITRTVADAATNHNTNVRRTQTYYWNTANSAVSNLVSTVETSADGLKTWETTWNKKGVLHISMIELAIARLSFTLPFMARKLRLQYPGAIYHPPPLGAMAGHAS